MLSKKVQTIYKRLYCSQRPFLCESICALVRHAQLRSRAHAQTPTSSWSATQKPKPLAGSAMSNLCKSWTNLVKSFQNWSEAKLQRIQKSYCQTIRLWKILSICWKQVSAWKRLLHSKNSLLLSNLRGRLIKWFAELGFDALQVFLVNSLSFRSWESRKQSETNESGWQWSRILANFAALALTPFQRFGNPSTCSQAVLRASVLRALHRSRIQWCKIRYSK